MDTTEPKLPSAGWKPKIQKNRSWNMSWEISGLDATEIAAGSGYMLGAQRRFLIRWEFYRRTSSASLQFDCLLFLFKTLLRQLLAIFGWIKKFRIWPRKHGGISFETLEILETLACLAILEKLQVLFAFWIRERPDEVLPLLAVHLGDLAGTPTRAASINVRAGDAVDFHGLSHGGFDGIVLCFVRLDQIGNGRVTRLKFGVRPRAAAARRRREVA
jgi:hypothetical protein